MDLKGFRKRIGLRDWRGETSTSPLRLGTQETEEVRSLDIPTLFWYHNQDDCQAQKITYKIPI